MKNIASEILALLKKQYNDPKTALNYKTPFELLVATILSAQCTDERVNKITPDLFKKYKDVYGFSKASQEELEKDVKSCGFFRNKAKSIIETSLRIVQVFGSKVPDNMADLLTLRGVARKTANIILSSCYGKAEGIAVDTHVARLAKRFQFTEQTNPDKIERDLMKIFDKKDWLQMNYLLVEHGRALCKAINPKCQICFLQNICPEFNKNKKTRPFVTIKYAQSIDGKIAAKTGDSKWISNETARTFAHSLRSKNDAILVGINTVLSDDPELNVRLVKGKSPARIILDSDLKTPIESQIAATAKKIRTIIFTKSGATAKIKVFENLGIEIFRLKNMEIETILGELSKIGIKNLLVEGGGKIITAFVEKKLFDKIYVIISPIYIGNDGISAIQNLNILKIKESLKLKLVSVEKLNDNLICELTI